VNTGNPSFQTNQINNRVSSPPQSCLASGVNNTACYVCRCTVSCTLAHSHRWGNANDANSHGNWEFIHCPVLGLRSVRAMYSLAIFRFESALLRPFVFRSRVPWATIRRTYIEASQATFCMSKTSCMHYAVRETLDRRYAGP
jgi:hypothetical protein